MGSVCVLEWEGVPLGSEGLQVADGQQEGMELKLSEPSSPHTQVVPSLFAPEPLEFFPLQVGGMVPHHTSSHPQPRQWT